MHGVPIRNAQLSSRMVGQSEMTRIANLIWCQIAESLIEARFATGEVSVQVGLSWLRRRWGFY